VSAVGVLGGSFDPVHRGHVALAARARRALGLSRVLLLPCADPPHKPQRTLASRYHRLEMIELAIEGWEGLGACTLEIAAGGVHYTIDTLRRLRAERPDTPPVFLIGSDAVRSDDGSPPEPPAWPASVAGRWSDGPVEGLALGRGGRIVPLAIPTVRASSTEVRTRRASGQPIVDLVPARVARYIQRHGLYGREATR
jgi:nicotinate-nucleotide adenylyltransferase